MAKQFIEKKRDDGSLIYRIDRQKKTGDYFVNSDSKQAEYVQKIRLHGFDSFPSGLWREGYGFTAAGSWLISEVGKEVGGKLKVTLSAINPSGIRVTKGQTSVTINHNRLKAINNVFRGIKKERNSELRAVIEAFLAENFPNHFSATDDDVLGYQPGKIAQMLEDEVVVNNLSDDDKDALRAIFPSLIGEMAFSLKSANKVKIIAEGLKKTQRVYLEKIVAEYEKKLKGKASEGTWQTFLRSHILMLLSTYAAVIEKQSVDLDGKYPDFMLVDAYGYLDVYEIKKPQTTVFNYDKSRKNYHWSVEVAKAISQTEKYLDKIQQYRLDLEDKLRRGKIEAHIVRPRGFIIVGKRSDLTTDAMREDFRVLNDGLKNVDLIFYDDLLDNLKSLLHRITDHRSLGRHSHTGQKYDRDLTHAFYRLRDEKWVTKVHVSPADEKAVGRRL